MSQSNDSILALNQKAQSRKAQGIDVTNGSIGMMYRDDGSLPVSTAVRQLLAKHTLDADLTYPSVAGGNDYQTALRHWFLGNAFEKEAAAGRFLSLGTPGGTGAVALAFHTFKHGKSVVVLPSLNWPNYEGIAKGFDLDVAYYNLFDGSHFDLAGLKVTLAELTKSYDSLLLVINDPCHNPSGYSLSPKEWSEVLGILNAAKGQIRLLVDAAYIDFAEPSQRAALVDTLKGLAPSVIAYLAFSFSKTLSFYGLRIGGLAITGANEENVDSLYHAAVMNARALWSTPNHMAMNAISELLNDPQGVAALQEETKQNRQIVAKRAAIFLKEAQDAGLHPYPYSYGFFVTLALPKAAEVSAKLVAQDIYLAPIQANALRIALCSLPTEKVYGLANKIKEAL